MSKKMDPKPKAADRLEPWPLDTFADDTASFPSDDNAQLLLASANGSISTTANPTATSTPSSRSRVGRGLRTFRITEGSLTMEADPRCTFDGRSGSQEAEVTPEKTTKGKLKSCAWRLVRLVRSMGGLIVLLLAYTLVGAWIMMEIEGPKESQQQAQVISTREDTAEKIKNRTGDMRAGLINESEWEAEVDTLLHDFEKAVFQSGLTSTTTRKWTYFGAVLFCVTTYTTIGYGNIAPVTTPGRVATMLYATIGIPLALIVLADVGRHFMNGTKFLWAFVRRYYYTGYCRKVRQRRHGSYSMTEAYQDAELANGKAKVGGKKGQGGQAEAAERRNGTPRDIEAGVPETTGVDSQGGQLGGGGEATTAGAMLPEKPPRPGSADEKDAEEEKDHDDEDDVANRNDDDEEEENDVFDGNAAGKWATRSSEREGRDPRRSVSLEPAPRSHEPSVTTLTNSADRRSVVTIESAEEEFHLPVVIAIAFIFIYIFLGAFMYTLWEKWTFFESFYFVFITVCTIGYGDILPQHPNFFLLSCVYTFLGLALVSMTINVIMEFLTRTIETAKEKVDQAREKALATAKAARGKLTKAGVKARRKMKQTISKAGSLRNKHEEDASLDKNS